jgi:hypothetical protein
MWHGCGTRVYDRGMAKWHVSGIETARSGILVEANSAEEAKALAEEIDMEEWTDGGEWEFVIDHVSLWNEE